jgi:hypothetical protein
MEQTTLSLSGWCKFGHYDAAFGWGKPAWVSSYGFTVNTFKMISFYFLKIIFKINILK